MKVTSDTLFHYTTSLENLKKILTNKFRLTFCHEKYQLDSELHDLYYPMVSFCDIPLSLAKDQISRYGSFAIGMTKEWGIRNRLNPVVYVEKDSFLAKDIQAATTNMMSMAEALTVLSKKNLKVNVDIALGAVKKVQDYIKQNNFEKKDILTDELDEAVKQIAVNGKDFSNVTDNFFKAVHNNSNLFRYIKNYRGTLIRNKKAEMDYRFYDEREWRYIPEFNDPRLKNWLNEADFIEYRGTTKTKPFIKDVGLAFDGNDIKYLIVKTNNDIPKLIKTIRSVDHLTKNTFDTDVLTTKIMTVEQLATDF